MSRKRWVALAVLALSALAGCAKHDGILAPAPNSPVVFADEFGDAVTWQSFDPAAGAKTDALQLDASVAYSGSRSIRVTIPGPGDPSGTWAGGAFTTTLLRDLSGYDALTFWARADHPITFDEFGIGNDNTGSSKYTASRKAVPIGTSWTRVVIALPLPARMKSEGGLFFFSEAPEAGVGATVWLDDIQFERLGTVSNPRPSFTSATLTPDIGSDVAVPGTRVVVAVDGVDQSLGVSQNYFTFLSSADTVVVAGEGTVRVVGLGTATVTGELGDVPATGALTINPKPAPLTAAPAPALPAANVISLFSDSYSNVPVDTWSASWDLADVTDTQISGNHVKKYTNLTYAGIEFTGAHLIDATSMTHFHVDVWSGSGTTFKVKLVDFGANGIFGGDDKEQELTFNAGSTPAFSPLAWRSLDIPLASFVNLTTRAHLAQLILSGDVGTVYVDNIYFHN